MANGGLSWVNHLAKATMTASSEASDSTKVTNLLGPHRAGPWRASSLTPFVEIDLGSAKTIAALGIFGANLSATATRRWRASNVSFTTGDLLDTTAVNAGIVSGIGQSLHYVAGGISARYLRLDIDDSLKPDAATVPYVDIGLAWVGDLWLPNRNFEYGFADQRDDRSSQSLTLGGQVYTDVRPAARVNNFNLPWLSDTEAKTQIRQIDIAVGLQSNLLWLPNPGGSDMNGEAILGVLTGLNPVTQQFFNVRSRNFEIRERL